MPPLNGPFQTAAWFITITSFHMKLTVSNFDVLLAFICALVQGLYYNSTAYIWTDGCVEPVYEFLQANSEFILAPIIITVSSFELIFLTKAYLCGTPSESVQYLK